MGEVNLRNLGYFEAEVQKLDAWADDLKSGLENEVKALDREIKEVRRSLLIEELEGLVSSQANTRSVFKIQWELT